MHGSEDRKTEWTANEYDRRWRRRHRRKLEHWDRDVKAFINSESVEGQPSVAQPRRNLSEDVMNTPAVPAIVSNNTSQETQDTAADLDNRHRRHQDDDNDSPEKIKVQHLDAVRIKMGSGWVSSTSSVKYILTYYDHEQRMCLQTQKPALEQSKQRGGRTQFLWTCDLIWRVWTSSQRACKEGNVIVHLVFAAPPVMRERMYHGKKMYAYLRSVQRGCASVMTQTRSYIMLEVNAEKWSLCERVLRLKRGTSSTGRHTILFQKPPSPLRGWTNYDCSVLRDILSAYELRLAAGDDTILGAWIRAWAKGLKTEDDPWYVKFCLLCEEVIEEYMRALKMKNGFWAVAECASCGKNTAWYARNGMRYLVEDFCPSGDIKAGAVPHYFCSDLVKLQRKYRDNKFISTILQELRKASELDRWKLMTPCGKCPCCRSTPSTTTTEQPVPAATSTTVTTDQPVPAATSTTVTTEQPVPAATSTTVTAEQPVPAATSTTVTAEQPVPAATSQSLHNTDVSKDDCPFCTKPVEDVNEGGEVVCDSCEQWFHLRCLGKSEEWVHDIDAYICDRCEQK
jgi:hypothetical protein